MRVRFLSLCLILCAAAIAFGQTAEDWYLNKPIKDITFEGLNHVDSAELAGVVQPFIGRLFDESLYWDLQSRLYGLEYFDSIAPSAVPVDAAGSAVILKFVVTEKPTVDSIQFEGISALRRTELLDVVTVKINDVASSPKLRADELAIKDKYLERGYPDVKVAAETRPAAGNKLTVVFKVEEGEQVAIEAFRFEGNQAFSERTLRGLLSLKSKSLLNDGAFQEAKLAADQMAILGYYGERGYVDAAIADVARELRKDDQGRNLLTLTFKIVEGRQYMFGGISFEGNKIFSTEKLSALVVQQKDQVINAKRLQSDFQRIADLYYENGYIYNSISQNETRDEEAGSISFKMVIVERGRAHIENIIIRGNVKTKDEVIRREIPLEPGDIFSKSKVIDGLRNLYNLQFFSAVTPDTPRGSADNLMDLVFTVEEQPTTDIQFGVTFSGMSTPGAFPISGLIKWNDRNFLGNGNTVGIELTAAPDAQKVSLQYTERWLFGLPLSGGFDFTVNHSTTQTAQDLMGPTFNGDETNAFPDPYQSYEEYVAANKTIPDAYLMDYDQWNLSLGFSSGYRFGLPIGNLAVSGGIRSALVRNAYDETLFRPFDPTLRDGNGRWSLAESVWASLSLDDRDIYYDPSSGYYASQRLSWVGILPFEKERYVRTDTKAEFFATLFDLPLNDAFNLKAVLGLHSGLSMILPQFAGAPVIESTNRLSLDGMFVARGWYDQRTNYGSALWESWAELRVPVAPGVLALDAFLDAATVKSDPTAFFTTLGVGDFKFSTGLGMRFTIPQFPFRFSLAKRFVVDNGQLKWQSGNLWHDSAVPTSGLDFVISLTMSTY
jgi:outer membrane protein insertion porin family